MSEANSNSSISTVATRVELLTDERPPILSDTMVQMQLAAAKFEGFKSGDFPKLEVWREAVGKPPLWREAAYRDQIRAVASDGALPPDAPAALRLDDLSGVVRCVRVHAVPFSAPG